MADLLTKLIRGVVVYENAAEKHRRRIAEIGLLVERLYTDKLNGKVSDERYEKMSSKLETEQAELTAALAALEDEIAEKDEQARALTGFLPR